jgi:hypothetical protein
VLGAQRRATRAAVGSNLGAAAARASAPAMSTSAIPGTTVLSATDRESHSALQQSLNKINSAVKIWCCRHIRQPRELEPETQHRFLECHA